MDDEDYKRISEEVAQQLCASMNEFAMVAEESAMALKKYSDVMSKYVLEKSLESFYNMIEKYVQASFLTKWWYKRKLNKTKYALPELVRMINETWEEKK